jgi:hypothetical protein
MNYTLVKCGFWSSPTAPWEERHNVPFGTHGASNPMTWRHMPKTGTLIIPLCISQNAQVGVLFSNALPTYSRNNTHCMNFETTTQSTVEESNTWPSLSFKEFNICRNIYCRIKKYGLKHFRQQSGTQMNYTALRIVTDVIKINRLHTPYLNSQHFTLPSSQHGL